MPGSGGRQSVCPRQPYQQPLTKHAPRRLSSAKTSWPDMSPHTSRTTEPHVRSPGSSPMRGRCISRTRRGTGDRRTRPRTLLSGTSSHMHCPAHSSRRLAHTHGWDHRARHAHSMLPRRAQRAQCSTERPIRRGTTDIQGGRPRIGLRSCVTKKRRIRWNGGGG